MNELFQMMSKKQRAKTGPVEPGPRDLTADKIAERMKRIRIGDMIGFNSYKEAYTTADVDRPIGSTIPAKAPVVEHHGGYVVVELRNGIRETVSYFAIESVNNKRWIGFCRPETPPVTYQMTEEKFLWT